MSLRSAISLFRGQREFHANIIGRRRWWFLLSGAIIVVSLLGLFVRHLNLGIDFEGGAVLEYQNATHVSAEEVRAEMTRLGHPDAVVQLVNDGTTVQVRTESLGGDERDRIRTALGEQAGIDPNLVNVTDVGPKWGGQISSKALQGLIIFLVVVTIYIALRFEWKMSIAALVALFHDLIITAGVYALVGREVTPETVIAILTILGYSLYDTVVIFDKVKENTESLSLVSRETYAGTVNVSLNQVMMRSINTSLVVLLPVGALMLFGGETLKDFAFALFVGILTGTYSSIFVASPILAVLKEREPRLAQIRERAARREGRPDLRPVPAPSASRSGGERTPELATVAAPAPRAPGQAARRRGKKKRSRAKRKRRR